MVMPAVEIVAPEVAPRRFGLLSVADLTGVNIIRSLAGTEYRSNGCVPVHGVAGDLCGTQEPKAVTEDDDWANGFGFTTFVQRRCRAVADWPEAKDRTTSLFAAGEQNAMETALWGYLVSAAADATVLHGGTALSPADAVAALEGYAGRHYAGDPVIHGPRGLISLVTDKGPVERHGNRLETVIGASVVAGGGYGQNGPGGVAAADGVSWMFVTGKVFGEQGAINVSGPHLVQSPRDNEAVVIAERSNSLNVDCLVAAVLVTNDGITVADGA